MIIKEIPLSAMTYFNILPRNTKLLAQLDVYNGKFQFPNPVRADTSVYVMCDVVHMIKVCIIMCNAFVYYLLGLDIDDVIIHR